MFSLFVQHLAIDDSETYAFGGHDQTAATTRQVVAHLGPFSRTDGVVIKNRHIRRLTNRESSSVLQTKELSRLRGDALDGMLQGHSTLITYPGADQVGAVVG